MKFNFVGFLQFLSKQKDCAGEVDKFTYALIYLERLLYFLYPQKFYYISLRDPRNTNVFLWKDSNKLCRFLLEINSQVD